MGYMMVFGFCWSCKSSFSFNPDWVPSLRVDGEKQPICSNCMSKANAKRANMNLPPHPIHPEAYAPAETA